jgi:thymidylate synthase|tara:strand:+ start:275 stop:1267 length:993 start_codon:yes stop_codon:yes gene_type:complete
VNTFDNFTDCYLSLASQVFNDYDFISQPRGQKIREKLAMKFIITNPRSRILYVRPRKFSIQYMIAELLWYISGEQSTEWIANYSSFWRDISDDGKTANSAYGARIFRPHPCIADSSLVQWAYIVNELRKDPDSRRAIIHIRSPWDSVNAKLDMPCTLALQFFIRDGALHQVVNMRSSDLILGIAYDVPAFTFFQEMLALELGVELGTYTHISNSLHIYERHFGMTQEMLAEDAVSQAKMDQLVRGNMPSLLTHPPIRFLYLFEQEIRKTTHVNEVIALLDELALVEIEGVEDYWMDWGKLLASHRLKKIGLIKEAKDLQNSTRFVGFHIL